MIRHHAERDEYLVNNLPTVTSFVFNHPLEWWDCDAQDPSTFHVAEDET